MEDEILFYGHPNITALHQMTVEITKTEGLTAKGDCIVGVNASKACYDLPEGLKRNLRDENSVVRISIAVDDKECNLLARGSPSLTLANRHDIVIRKSSFVCPRTLAIKCDKASNNVPRDIIKMLKDPVCKGILRISVE